MNATEITVALIAAVASIFGAVAIYRGGGVTAKASKEASTQQTKVDAQESALQAWQALLQPHIDDVRRLREDLGTERDEREADRARHEREREGQQRQIQTLVERVDLQAEQIKHWKRLAKVIARWASTLRDEVLRLGGTVPSTPDELLLIQSLDDESY